jgi:hypothetical protein
VSGSPAVVRLALELWEEREASPVLRTLDVPRWARRLALAVAEDVAAREKYDPEDDARVQWIREILASRRRGDLMPKASGGAEGSCAFLLGKLEVRAGEPEETTIYTRELKPLPDLRVGKMCAAGD